MSKVMYRSVNFEVPACKIRESARRKMYASDDPEEIRAHAHVSDFVADLQLRKFDPRYRTGPRSKTQKRIEMILRLLANSDPKKRQMRALMLWEKPEVLREFEKYESLYRFLGRDEFL